MSLCSRTPRIFSRIVATSALSALPLVALACASPEAGSPAGSSDMPMPASTDALSPASPSGTGPSTSGTAAPTATASAPVTPSTTLTYHRDAAPVLKQYCASCHSTGGLAPFALDSYAGAAAVGVAVSAVVSSGQMPPLPADNNCRPLDDPRVMPSTARQILVDWVAQGAVEGDPNQAPPVPSPSGDVLGPPDQIFDSGLNYLSQFPGTDEYRCFLIDVPVTTPIDAIAFGVSSTNLAIVHHAFVELVRPADLAAVQQLDAADATPGWDCFGGSGFDSVRLAGYVPGSQPKPSPNGTGITLPVGSRFVVNTHYNFLTNREANRLSVQVWAAKQPLTGTPRGVRLGNRSFVLQPGATNVVATHEVNIVSPGQPKGLLDTVAGQAWGASGHMHMLGQAIRIDVIHADKSEECLLSIPEWDFHWQGDYRWKEPLALVPGDKVRLTCTWDNSAAKQPIIDGVQQVPGTVRWGEKSTDEMCLGGVTLTD